MKSNQLLTNLKRLVELGVEFESQSFKGLKYIPKDGDIFIDDFLITLPSVEWVEERIVDWKNNQKDKYNLRITNNYYGIWVYVLTKTYKQHPIQEKHKDRLTCATGLLVKLLEEK